MKLDGGDDFFDTKNDPIDGCKPCDPKHQENQVDLKIEEVRSGYDLSKDLPEELRMIHRFLRESNHLKFKFTPNYARFKWMAKNIFLYVGLERTLTESLYQSVSARA